MKNIENSKKNSFLKRIFIKLSRKLGFEIIDQNTFEIVTLNKKINDEISTIGKNSINLPRFIFVYLSPLCNLTQNLDR